MIQRYFKAHNVRTNKSEMVPDNVYGNFILYSDHEAAIKEKDKRIADLTAERDRLREAAIMAHRVLLQMNDHEDYTIRTINDLAAAIAQDAIGKEGK